MRVVDYVQKKNSQESERSSRVSGERSVATKSISQSTVAFSIDPEEEAFKALKKSICSICKKQNITTVDDKRLQKIVNKYKGRYPKLTPELILEEIEADLEPVEVDDCSPPPRLVSPGPDHSDKVLEFERNSLASSKVDSSDNSRRSRGHSTASSPANASAEEKSMEVAADSAEDDTDVYAKTSTLINGLPSYSEEAKGTDKETEFSTSKVEEDEKEPSGCWYNFKSKCKENNGYNLCTYTILLTFLVILMFATSVIYTYMNYNQDAYRDWALAGGVTSSSAEFRVRGPSSDDGKAREFVVSVNPNLAIERDQILNVPVSYGDFEPDEHYMKRISLGDLSPLTPYYYGITRPKRTPNSAEVAGDVGTFVTPAPEGDRMDFTIATGSCALTGSKSGMFENVLKVNPIMFIHMGDMHYEDLNTLEVDKRLEAYDKVMGSPTQRLLYMRTIFSYTWDDHDWIGNNQDSEDEAAASVAKQGYTLGIPHYPLGSASTNEANAAKYQAFTIGTVRFIISDLRSESIKSSEYYSGKIYSREQKEWLFNELSQAANYDFVVWVSSRPWTDAVELGSDSWGGFPSDRDELSAHIANTVGAGPRNLLVLSGDNHMVAFDDGSSTDLSGQEFYPGGFPLLHSGPMTNYGSSLVNFFKPTTNYFTNGCMAYNSEINHQFSTIDFSFPTREDRSGCMRIRSYSEDVSNIIFERELCGEIMTYGTPEQDTCTLKKLSVPTQSLFIAAAGLILINGIFALWFLGMNRIGLALSYTGLAIIYYLLTIAAAVGGAFCFGILGVNMFVVSIFVCTQCLFGSFFLGMALLGYCEEKSEKHQPADDEEVGVKDSEVESKKLQEDEDEAATHEDTFDQIPALPVTLMSSNGKENDASEIIKDLETDQFCLAADNPSHLGKRQQDDASVQAVLCGGETDADKAPSSADVNNSAVDSSFQSSAVDNSFESNFSSVQTRDPILDYKEGLAAVLSSAKNISLPDVKDMKESFNQVYSRSIRALTPSVESAPANEVVSRQESKPPIKETVKEEMSEDEGIEITNPGKGYDLRVSPSLMSF